MATDQQEMNLKSKVYNVIHPRSAVVIHDLTMVWLAWILAHLTRYTFAPGSLPFNWFSTEVLVVLLLQGSVLWWTGLYRGLWRFASLPDLANILKASIIGTLLIALALVLYNRIESAPRSVFSLYPVLLTLFLGAPRIIYRFWKDNRQLLQTSSPKRRVIIVGAGRSADMLVREIKRETAYRVVGFVDDKKRLKGAKLQGIPVLGAIADLDEIARETSADLIIIAIPSASNHQMQTIVQACESTSLEFLTMPRLQDFVHGISPIQELKEVAIEDLLGRESVVLQWDKIAENLSGKSILITGGGGSIGSELSRQLARISPSRLVILESSEHNLYEIERSLRNEFPDLFLEAILGDVTNEMCCNEVMQRTQPEVVFHAAAYKHVPMLENQVREAIHNNVLGTQTIANAADRYGVKTFVLISTDKAVNPTNVMGASKRVAEIYCQYLAAQSDTRFITVRFGNVLNSAGSVVPLFQEQIRKGGPVTVTHPDVTRYFMTIPEASQLIMQAAIQGEGGEIFILDMGDPIKIHFLAEQMIRLTGKEPDLDIRIIYTGLRPGEKLYEELFHEHEACSKTVHDKILLAKSRAVNAHVFSQQLVEMESAVKQYDQEKVKLVLKRIVPEFTAKEIKNHLKSVKAS